jgi:acyl-coenzyme A synthetase/AMP-(fatty) acid ligase
VFVIGRYKELIKYRNINVFDLIFLLIQPQNFTNFVQHSIKILPTNVEKHMMTHPAIEDVAVVGSPHEEDGERPLAFVVLSEDSKVTAEELISFTNGSFRALTQFQNKTEIFDSFYFHILGKVMEEEKLRGGIRFVEKIPRNDLGKIVRPELVQLLKFK